MYVGVASRGDGSGGEERRFWTGSLSRMCDKSSTAGSSRHGLVGCAGTVRYNHAETAPAETLDRVVETAAKAGWKRPPVQTIA